MDLLVATYDIDTVARVRESMIRENADKKTADEFRTCMNKVLMNSAESDVTMAHTLYRYRHILTSLTEIETCVSAFCSIPYVGDMSEVAILQAKAAVEVALAIEDPTYEADANSIIDIDSDDCIQIHEQILAAKTVAAAYDVVIAHETVFHPAFVATLKYFQTTPATTFIKDCKTRIAAITISGLVTALKHKRTLLSIAYLDTIAAAAEQQYNLDFPDVWHTAKSLVYDGGVLNHLRDNITRLPTPYAIELLKYFPA